MPCFYSLAQQESRDVPDDWGLPALARRHGTQKKEQAGGPGQHKAHLSQRFEVQVDRDSANQRLYRFTPKADSLNRTESQQKAIQAA
jgi:hypothetical protein